MLKDASSKETLPYDVVALCSLLSRIMHRCLAEKDAQFLALLSQNTTEVECLTTVQLNEVTDEKVA